jgi:hypothetical protein
MLVIFIGGVAYIWCLMKAAHSKSIHRFLASFSDQVLEVIARLDTAVLSPVTQHVYNQSATSCLWMPVCKETESIDRLIFGQLDSQSLDSSRTWLS